MNSKTIISLVNICRTCTTEFSQTNEQGAITNKHSIFDVVPTVTKKDASIIEILQFIQPQIKVDMKDNRPTLICSNCLDKLILTYEFIEMYRNADSKFRSILMQSNNKSGVNDLNDSLQIINKNDLKEEKDEMKCDDVPYEVNKYEIVDNLNIKGKEEREDSDNYWQEFDDLPLYELSEEEAVGKKPLFLNPYSDASDNECIPAKKRLKTTSQRECRQRSKDTTTQIASNKILIKNVTKEENDIEKLELPKENENGSITCLECHTVLENIKLWQKHMQNHRLEKESEKSSKPRKNVFIQKRFECEHCGKGFSRTSAYEAHLQIHSGKEPYLCNECGKSFKSGSSLNKHMLRHKGEKTYLCPKCPKKFICSSGLYGHMMVHKKEKPFVCDICGSAFHMANQLRKHNVYHIGIKKFQCEYCDKAFVTSGKQRRHMRAHTGEKPYRCKYCDKAFAQSNVLIKHLKKHLGDNVYQCELCPLRFPFARDLRTHFATHINDDETTRSRNLEARLEETRNLQIKL